MSRVQNRQSGPQLYNYESDANRITYIAPSQPNSQGVSQPTSLTPPQVVSIFKTSNVQPVITSQTIPPVSPVSNTQNSPPLKVSQHQKRVQPLGNKQQTRYQNYQDKQYKYNLFSLFDQSWNRCLQAGKCGSCPGNEFVARQVRGQGWNLL